MSIIYKRTKINSKEGTNASNSNADKMKVEKIPSIKGLIISSPRISLAILSVLIVTTIDPANWPSSGHQPTSTLWSLNCPHQT